MYDGQCFIGKVTFEAALRVLMFWVRKVSSFMTLFGAPLIKKNLLTQYRYRSHPKATRRLNRTDVGQSVPPDAYLDLLKSGWLFTLIRKDLRSGQSSDELKALISLISGVSHSSSGLLLHLLSQANPHLFGGL